MSKIKCNRYFSFLVKKILIRLLPYVVPVLIVTALFFFVIYLLFVLPKFIIESVNAEDGGKVSGSISIFSTGKRDDWQLSDDQRLYDEYINLYQGWLDQFTSQEALYNSKIENQKGEDIDNNAKVGDVWARFYDQDSGIPSERVQAKSHGVNWGLMAAVDRILGDPLITGLMARNPNPQGHFDKLKPQLHWENFELYYRYSWSESSSNGEGVIEKSRTYRHTIPLLVKVESYEVKNISYDWKRTKYYYKDSKRNIIEEAYYPVLVGTKQEGPYFEKLRQLLMENQLPKNSDLELILNLAMNYDEDFKYFASYLSGNITELFADTENDEYFNFKHNELYRWPLEDYHEITSAYGWRVHPILRDMIFHKGIDIACPKGTPILSAWSGKVLLAGWISGYGKMIMINHGKYKTVYGHLDKIRVKIGQEIDQGQNIGNAGSTGLSSGDHLHFEIRSGQGETIYLDPMSLDKDKGGD
ncbi:MAG: M23 family metallopeptidase [Peptococcaceae bacterium]|nr:M23 family metallopeptidase [Peptococcaceae bacterium]